jgi:hypothetical protein
MRTREFHSLARKKAWVCVLGILLFKEQFIASPATTVKAVPKFVELTQNTDVFTELRTDQKIHSDGLRTEEANLATELNI